MSEIWHQAGVMETLTRLWNQDRASAADIAALLNRDNPGFSVGRSSVLGKVHRLNDLARRAGKPLPFLERAGQMTPEHRAKMRGARARAKAEREKPKRFINKAKASTPENARPPRPEGPPRPVEGSRRIPLMELDTYPHEGGAKDCRWPLGDPRDKDFGFCGLPQLRPGSRYCEGHCRMAWPDGVDAR